MSQASQLLPVYAAYLVATASPGPSNMAIMGTAMREGRRPALVLAAGVVAASMTWAMVAASGIAALLAASPAVLWSLRVGGGAYLLYLAWRSGRSALRPEAAPARAGGPVGRTTGSRFRQGFLMHVGNPKAVIAWVAIMSLGLGSDASAGILPAMVLGCALLGILVFGAYAVVFSTAPMIAAYARLRRWIEGTFAVLFACAGLRLLAART